MLDTINTLAGPSCGYFRGVYVHANVNATCKYKVKPGEFAHMKYTHFQNTDESKLS